MRVALTQAQGRLEGLGEELTSLGLTVVRVPLLEIQPRLCDDVRRQGHAFSIFPWLLFSSRSAVEAWSALELSFSGPSLGAVGPATAREIERAGGRAKIVGAPPDAEGLATLFLQHTSISNFKGPVGLPLGTLSPPWLRRRLEIAGHQVVTLEVYETLTLGWPKDIEVDAVILASASAVKALPTRVAGDSTLITIGRSTSRAVRDRGFVPIEARAPSRTAIVQAVHQSRRTE